MVNDEEIKSIWKSFVLGDTIDLEKVRPVILESWQRCKDKVNPFQKRCPYVLEEEDLEKRLEANSKLLQIARPIMNKLYEYVAGSEFAILLCDGEGYCLERIGDQEILDMLSLSNFVLGASLAEKKLGTNAVGTAIYANQPLQVYSYEHWCVSVHIGTCSAAPIHDPDTGKVIGVLDMTGTFDKVHSHTLGMVVAAAYSIEGQIAVQRNWERAMLADQYKALIMESISEGLIVIDNSKTITHINGKAIELLSLDEEPVGQKIYSVLNRYYGSRENFSDLYQLIESKEKAFDELVSLQNSTGPIRCMVTTRCLLQEDKVIGKILVLGEISRVNKLVSRVVGGQARFSFENLIGQDKSFLESIDEAVQASKTQSNVLLLGESGTGKDLFAQSIHNSSSRRNGPFIAINCAGIPRELLGSELFGYVDGAFTGAKKGGNPGKFELADGGTIFLDEIGDMPLDMQTSLLRVTEEKAVMRIGSNQLTPVDVRIISATHKDLMKEIESGNFRSDLYYRLNVINIKLPALRERKQDIQKIISYLIQNFTKNMGKKIETVEPEFIQACLAYDWPGNVRELCNIVERAVSLSRDSVISARSLPVNFHKVSMQSVVDEHTKIEAATMDTEKRVILNHLERYEDNRSLVAKELGISRSTLYRKLKKLGL